MSKMITDFGLQTYLASATANKKLSDSELQGMEQLIDTMLFSMPHDQPVHGSESFAYNGDSLTYSEAAELIRPYIEQIRLSSVQMFEKYFAANSNSTNTDNITRDYNSGAQDAKRVLRRMCIFPLEAMNVRTEIAHPDVLHFNSGQNGRFEKIHGIIIRAVIGDEAIGYLEGPHLPPIPVDTIVAQMQDMYGQLDFHSRQILSGAAPMPTSTMN